MDDATLSLPFNSSNVLPLDDALLDFLKFML